MSRPSGTVAVVLVYVLGGLGTLALVTLGYLFLMNPFSPNAEANPSKKDQRDEFAADRDGGDVVAFDTKRALGYLKDVCAIGPRISGTEGMQKQQELLTKHFEDLGGKVALQKFEGRQNSRREPVEMANLIVRWFPDRERRVILCSHYDTRPIADQEYNRSRWTEPFLSANDGGSGVALLMELAHHMKDLKTNVGVDFVFFDGEEYIFKPDGDRYFLGSEHFADAYRKGQRDADKPKYRYAAAILLDMIAGKSPRFPVEPNSWFAARGLVDQVWGIAAELKCGSFQYAEGTRVEDDHVALNRGGIPAIDIIDFSYKHWHRLSDRPENCSGEGLEQVGRVLAVWLQRVK
jgi:glutaminyl-peptide cyclotransferase